jgi:beta-phosphoglucomutase
MSGPWDWEWLHIPTAEEFNLKFPSQKSVIWDMDGTLVDSEGHHAVATSKATESIFGLSMSGHEILQKFVGMPDDHVFEELLKGAMHLKEKVTFGHFLQAKSIYLRQIYAPQGLSDVKFFHDKILHLISGLKDQGKSLALVTASENQFMHDIMKLLPRDFFDFKLGRQDTALSKPHPMPYLKAMEMLKVTSPKEEVIILEDSPTGLAAAVKSGATVAKVSWFG